MRSVPGTYSIVLEPNLAEVASGRNFLASIAEEAGFPEDRVFDITVACSEAMANAIEHSPVKGAVEVRAVVYGDRLEVEVEGPGEFQTPDRLKERNSRGLGLPLMAKLSDHLALFSGPSGQTFVNLTFYKPGARTNEAGALPPSFVDLAEENQLLDDVLRHLPDGFYVLDDAWRFVYVNPAALSSASVGAEDLIGALIWEKFPEIPEAVRQAFETARAEQSVTRVVASMAGDRWREWTAFPVEEGVAVYSRDITERTTAQNDLRHQTELLQGLLQSVPANIAAYRGSDLRFVLVNAAFQAISPGTEMIGRTYAEVFPEAAAAGADARLRRVMETGEPWSIERYWAPVPGNPDAIWEGEAVRLPAADGEEPLVLAVSRDVTQSAQAEEALRISEERYRNLVEQSVDGIFLADADGCYLESNPAGLGMLGYTLEELRRLTLTDVINLEEVVRMPAQMADLAAGNITRNQWWFLRKDGCSFIGEVVGRQLPDGRLLGILRDITRQKLAEEDRERLPEEEQTLSEELAAINEELAAINEELRCANEELLVQTEELKEAEARLVEAASQRQLALDAARLGWWHYDPTSGISTWDRRYKEIFGVAEDERPNDEILKRLHPDDLPGVWASVEAALDPDHPAPYSAEYRIIMPDGSQRWIEAHGIGTFEGQGDARRATGLVGTVEDITEKKRADQALEFQAELLANVQDPMTGTDENLVITYWNDAAERVFGWKAEDVIGRPAVDVLQTRLPNSTRAEAIAELHATGQFRGELTYVKRDGDEVQCDVSTALLRHPDGSVRGTISVQHDVTERRKMEEALRRGEKRNRLLLQVADAVAEWTDLDKVLDASLQAVVSTTGHARASIGLLDPGRRQIHMAASAGLEPLAPASAPLASFSQALRDVIATGKSALVDYDRLPEEQRQVARVYRSCHSFVAPLVYHEQVTGVIMVDDPGEWVAFTDDEQDLIMGIAAQAAIAIENARLYEAHKSIAEQLQQTILDLPHAVPGIDYSHLYRSATEEAIVGGDFYDVFERSDGTIILLTGDVSGHGVNSARVATLVKASLAAFAQNGNDLSAILENTNQLLMRKRVPGFTSVLFGSYRPSTGLLEYCSAGHPNLMVGRSDGSVEILGQNHAPLGVFPDWVCVVDAVEVKPGDTLLLYTDGLTEARMDGVIFGEKRLSEALSRRTGLDLHKLPESLLSEALEYSGGKLQDDVAILAVRPIQRD